MSRVERLASRFVGDVPEKLKAGVLYVAAEHGVMMHLCACGCGNEVALPLSPIDWRLTFDGETISVSPSVGSWSLPCRSHYIIDHGQVRWAGDWSDDEIEEGRKRDQRRHYERYGPVASKAIPDRPEPLHTIVDEHTLASRKRTILTAVRRWLSELCRRW